MDYLCKASNYTVKYQCELNSIPEAPSLILTCQQHVSQDWALHGRPQEGLRVPLKEVALCSVIGGNDASPVLVRRTWWAFSFTQQEPSGGSLMARKATGDLRGLIGLHNADEISILVVGFKSVKHACSDKHHTTGIISPAPSVRKMSCHKRRELAAMVEEI
ncbi:hypothetical protein FQN60_018101 [Etheostoma spectabile]|uniref:Uncharacterized protein n=1 Tax=Etheostoma spectabile TaxID=54343 RepID=A0A5J5DGZ3_9PERO|nr:hypothetical protein FQN60_018101 [Etheostoma spectabile]